MMDTRLLLVTNLWNEENMINEIIKNISKQTLKPSLWVCIDDGSSDRSSETIIKEMSRTGIEMKLFQSPVKSKGNMDTIGVAYNRVMPLLHHLDFDYMSIIDVDNKFPDNYFEYMCNYLDNNPGLGAISGQVRGEPKRKRTQPMGGGKVIRWSIVQSIEKYWCLAPDSFLNLMTREQGYEARSLDILIDAEPTSIFTRKGRFNYGRRMYYVGRPVPIILTQAIALKITRSHGGSFLQGYCQEWQKGTWNCDIPEVRRVYSDEFTFMNVFKRSDSGEHENNVTKKSLLLFNTFLFLLFFSLTIIVKTARRFII